MFQPTSLNERIHTLDIMRGFSLLGILIVNIFAFSLPLPHILDLHSWFTDYQDVMLYQTLDIYVQSSFYPLFSMLFGYGLAMQWIKAEQTGTRFYPFATKRLVVLFIIGLLHAFLIWWGDILTMYAFCGFFLILCLKLKSGWLLTVALAMNGLLHFFILSLYAIAGIANAEFETPHVDITAINNAITAYGIGTWTDAFFQRLNDLAVQMAPGMWISALFTILPYMMIGAAAAKWRLVERAKELKVMWIILTIICIAGGLFIKSVPFHVTRTYLLEYVRVYIGGPILAVGYASLIVVLCLIPFATKLLSPIAKVGRMSLTIYIMQSIICTLLFYNFGFGLYGKVDVMMGIVIAIGIYVVQLALSELWFLKYQQGPLEKAVKRITYGKNGTEN
ncbi:DUF418 domain-containing protein [Ureibacillus thermosphaericus]|uniref:DUF418 domain-containing protein n=1 Tax=Ureibacillus thermosphaericus TaxID=51173 RepID=UPI0002ECAAFB|nr:DUF418 domain-containing protein [Ureibacillus thermosphaericus]